MNIDLGLKNRNLVALSNVVGSYGSDQDVERLISHPELPSLQQVLEDIGPLPGEALFLGLAEDRLPVLLNLWDPLPGPILIAGSSQSGKTRFLQTLSRSAIATHTAGEIQYGVITNHPRQWKDGHNNSHCIGIFPSTHKSTTDFIHALALWTELKHNNSQSMLLLIDELDDFLFANSELSRELQTILSHGPAKRIWPFVTINYERFQDTDPWLQYFHTRMFGYIGHDIILDDNYSKAGFEGLLKGVEFCMKEKSRWLRFWIPTP